MPTNHSLNTIFQSARSQHVTFGTLLEIGPGRFWPGLQYLAEHPDLELIGAGYAPEERAAARQEARKLKLLTRADYREGRVDRLPVDDRSVDAVISYGSVHQWPRPLAMLDEIARVLKVGGRYFIGNVRRDASWVSTFWSGLHNPALRAVYAAKPKTPDLAEFKNLLAMSRLSAAALVSVGPDVWAVSK
ncbi:MAG: class I SAM-dependent methyltransferase [Candidatus Firestonebacteria bacterium]|nr:class I SAM-dependent methyltransferase [Candidatus Firestonebacteria bacterium]